MAMPRILLLLPLAMALSQASAGEPTPPVPLATGSIPAAVSQPRDAGALYLQICAECHGADRLGITGPPLIPENFGRLKREEAANLILQGRPATQMPAFADRLSAAEAQGLVDLIFTPPAETPEW